MSCIRVWGHFSERWRRQDHLLTYSKHDRLLSGLADIRNWKGEVILHHSLSAETERDKDLKEAYGVSRFSSNSLLEVVEEVVEPSYLEFHSNSVLSESEFVYGKGFLGRLLDKFTVN